ncbi:MAG: hypothetical protein HYW79_03515 [Parcubacteria group bacterium]|nr:hypothetical protein [Parcubacteria group bacterium]
MNTSKTWIWIIIAIVALALVWAVWQYGFLDRLLPTTLQISDNDTTAEIDKDLNAVDIGNPDQDLKNLDTDLNQL